MTTDIDAYIKEAKKDLDGGVYEGDKYQLWMMHQLQANLATEKRASTELKKGLDLAVADVKQLRVENEDFTKSLIKIYNLDYRNTRHDSYYIAGKALERAGARALKQE